MISKQAFKIHHYLINPAEFTIQVNGSDKQSLQPKFIEVLLYLAENHGRVVPRDELIDHIWGQDSYVGEKSLTNAIWHLRKHLISAEDEEEIIKTIRKAGYQLIPEPEWLVNPLTVKMESSSNVLESSINYSIDNAIQTAADNTAYHELPKTIPVTTHEHARINSTYMLLALIFTLIVLLMVQQFSSSDKTQITAITKHPGSELFPAPSPDGRYVVYSQVLNNQPTNLYMKDTHHAEISPKQITFDNATEGHSVWSNDGQYLYFSRKNKAENSCSYIQLKVDSQQETQLASCPMNGGYYYLDVSPDDQTLAVYNKGPLAKRTGIYLIDLSSEDYDMTRFSCDQDCNYKDRDMAFSPDGEYMAISRRVNRLSENIYLINLTTKATQQLTFNQEDIVGMSWFADSKKLVYATQHADNRFGFVIDIKSKDIQALNLSGFSYPSMAKQSQQLFYQERKESSSLVSLQLNNSIASSPFPVLLSNFTYESPDHSSVNDLIVFSSNESGFDELWSAKTDGSERKQLTNLKKNIRYPKWSHDGRKVAFLAPLSDETADGIYIYSLDNERVTLLNSPFSQHNRPNWSFDDSAIISAIYGDKHTDIYSINISNASTKRLTFDGGRYGFMITADTLLYTKLKRGLWQRNIHDDKEARPIIEGSFFNTLYAWTYDKDRIYYQKAYDDHYQLVKFDIKSNEVTPLVKLPLNSISTKDSISYLATEESLVFTSSSFPQANINMLASKALLKKSIIH